MSLRIEVNGVKLNYDVTFKSRYTVVLGCSASGKSFLADVLTSPETHPGYKIKLSDSEYEVVAGALAYRLVLKTGEYQNGKYVFVVDDDDFELSNTYKHLIETCTRSYFVILTRNEWINGINYGLEDVYEFIKVGNADVLIPAFTYDSSPYINHDTLVVSEDSKSGYSFYSELFNKNTVVHITDARGRTTGKDEVMSMLGRCKGQYSSIFLLLDWCSFGKYAITLSSFLACATGIQVYILRGVESFEHLLLSSNMFKINIAVEVLLRYISKEIAFEKVLEDVTRCKPYYQKHGGDLKECYVKGCCALYESKVVCDKFMHGKDKFSLLLKGTVGEPLLRISGRS